LKALCGVVVIAALALSSTAKAGLIGTGSASYCDPGARQVFAPWADSSYYVGEKRDSHSLLLPSSSSAVSSTVCFALGDWHLRLFARNVGSPTGKLHVQVVVPSVVGGLLTVLDGGTFSGTGTWAPSPRLELALCNVTNLVGTKAVAFRFTPVGVGASYQIDDVYLDPWKDF
jgi:hypothetical protein